MGQRSGERQDDRLPLLLRELRRLRLEVAALSEVRRPGSGYVSVGGYIYYWSGHSNGHNLQGVAIAISNRFQTSVVEVTPGDERIMVLRLKLAFGFMSLISVYTPTDVCKLDIKEMFYAKLVEQLSSNEQIFIDESIEVKIQRKMGDR
ncbi:craniofacial development protein 2-like [Penaeus vannamei]|uniref:craniofacial development protein 2-like n=1 Tax=Penaeus vannamei TaxID=6689 RepID=UPI00387F7EC4